MPAGQPTPLYTLLHVLEDLIEGLCPKRVAFKNNVTEALVYSYKRKYLKVQYVRNENPIVDPVEAMHAGRALGYEAARMHVMFKRANRKAKKASKISKVG